MSTVTSELAMGYSAAWAAHDPEAIVAMHTHDTVFDMHGLAEPAVGRDAVQGAIAALFNQSPDLMFEPRRVHLGADHFVSEYEVSGTVDGKHFACEGVDVFTIRDGLIARKDTYLDGLSYQRQVGVETVTRATP
ncbi:MAG TPA: nuclear transport factor 2 family protein [Pedococcus sp.]|jgi:ketosteroid isomerase-like protein|nr:nuclear transport factor 2 family protein [Pedococcus sp.]